MLRRYVDNNATFDCYRIGFTDWEHDIVVVACDIYPLVDWARCQVPIYWEWIHRRT